MLRRIAGRGIHRSASAGDDTALAEETLRILYQRKAFREETGRDEEHYLEGTPPSRHGHPQAPLRAEGPRRTSAPAGAAGSPAVIRPGSCAPSSAWQAAQGWGTEDRWPRSPDHRQRQRARGVFPGPHPDAPPVPHPQTLVTGVT